MSMDDLDGMFAETIESGGDATDATLDAEASIGQGAKINLGDGEVVGDQDTDTDDDESLDLDEDETSSDDDDESDEEENDDTEDDSDGATDEDADFDSIKDKLITVVVDGKAAQVTVAEARNGYMRQQDYTRKTQLVSRDLGVIQWAKEMQAAFSRDAEGTLLALAEHLGVELGSTDDDSDLEQYDEDVRPLAKSVKELQKENARLQRQSQQADAARAAQAQDVANRQAVETELNTMKAKYDDFDAPTCLDIAIKNMVNLEAAYLIWQGTQKVSTKKVSAETARKAEKLAETRDKARKATKQATRRGTSRTTRADDSWKKYDSFEDLFDHEMANSK